MDVLMEATIGDAHVSLRSGRHRHGVKAQVGMAAAFPATGTPNGEEVEAFLKLLRSAQTIDVDAISCRVSAAPLPAGYRHFRLFTDNGEAWHASFVVNKDRTLTLHDVLFGALNHPLQEIAAWRSTDWLPDMIPGVLDLELGFSTVPRTSKPFRLRL